MVEVAVAVVVGVAIVISSGEVVGVAVINELFVVEGIQSTCHVVSCFSVADRLIREAY